MKTYDNTVEKSGMLISREYCNVFESRTQPKPYIKPLPLDFERGYQSCTGLIGYAQGDTFYGASPLEFILRDKSAVTVTNSQRQSCENKLVEKIAEIRVNAADMYRTRKETMEMVSKRVNQLIHAWRSMKRGNWRQFKKALGITNKGKKPREFGKNSSGTWLEHSYGWSPLLSDIYTILNNTFEPPMITAKARYKETVIEEKTTSLFRSGFKLVRNSTDHVFQISITDQIDIHLDSPAIQAASQYGLLNPAAVAWEAVPFSFVVDWFYPVGDFLSQLNTTGGLKLSNWYRTETVEGIYSNECEIQLANFQPFYGPEYGQWILKTKRRYQVSGEPFFVPQISDAPLTSSLQRSINAIALFGALTLGKRN